MRLADRVFAPHYAAPVPRVIRCLAVLREGRRPDAAIVATLAAGSGFELLDLVGGDAWGIAVAQSLVGYVDAGALGEP